MNVSELKAFLNKFDKTLSEREDYDGEYRMSWDSFFDEELSQDYVDEDSPYNKELLNRGVSIKFEDSEGGYEGAGEHYHVVFSVTKDMVTTYFKVDGYYASYNGKEIDAWDFYVVEKVPVQSYEWRHVSR